MIPELEHISDNEYGNGESNPYDANPREKAHLLLDYMLDSYNSEMANENLMLRKEKEMLVRENTDLRNEIENKNEIIKGLSSQVAELFKALGMRGAERARQNKRNVQNKINSFRNLIQYSDPDKVIIRLHELIDGKSGMTVGAILKKAANEKILIRTPKESEFTTEFELIGTWRAISNYFDDSKIRVKDAVDNVKIF